MKAFDLSALAQIFFIKFETRFSRKEKDAFLEHCKTEFAELGYDDSKVMIQKLGNNKNLIAGAPDANILITAHYDTPTRSLFIPIIGQMLSLFVAFLICTMIVIGSGFLIRSYFSGIGVAIALGIIAAVTFSPLIFGLLLKNKNNRNDNTSGVLGIFRMAALMAAKPNLQRECAFILFDNEELGMLGSKAYAKWRSTNYPHKNNCKVINLDCVGDGNILLVLCSKKNETFHSISDFLKKEDYTVATKKSSLIFISDHVNFSNSVQLAFAKRWRGFLYLPRIHSRKDLVCNLNSIDRLITSIYKYIGTFQTEE